MTRQWLSLPPPVTPGGACWRAQVDGVTVLDGGRATAQAAHRAPARQPLPPGGARRRRSPPTRRRARDARSSSASPSRPAAPTGTASSASAPTATTPRPDARSCAEDGRRGRERALPGLRATSRSCSTTSSSARMARRPLSPGPQRRHPAQVAPAACSRTTEPEVDQARLARGEVTPTGPMFGHSMRAPVPESEAGSREAAILARGGLTPADFKPLGALAPGTRRAIAVAIAGAVGRADRRRRHPGRLRASRPAPTPPPSCARSPRPS